jgi:hypothetical protein
MAEPRQVTLEIETNPLKKDKSEGATSESCTPVPNGSINSLSQGLLD